MAKRKVAKKKRKTKTKYQLLLAAKASNCKGRTSAATLNKKKKAYIDDAVKKGKSKAEATKIANKVTKGSCPKK